MNADKLINDYAHLDPKQKLEFDLRYKELHRMRKAFKAMTRGMLFKAHPPTHSLTHLP